MLGKPTNIRRETALDFAGALLRFCQRTYAAGDLSCKTCQFRTAKGCAIREPKQWSLTVESLSNGAAFTKIGRRDDGTL
jgi:hypothetical protein